MEQVDLVGECSVAIETSLFFDQPLRKELVGIGAEFSLVSISIDSQLICIFFDALRRMTTDMIG